MARRHVAAALLLAPVAAYVGACAMLYATQRRHIYNPTGRANAMVPTMPLPGRDADVLVSVRAHAGPVAIVYFGGNSEDVSTSVPLLAEAFAQAAIYALHYRGFGGSGGTPTEADLVADALALYDTVRKRHRDVVVIGRSLGTGVAIQVAARRRSVRRLVLVTPYDSIAEVAQGRYPAFPARWIVKDRYESWRIAPRIRVPTTVIAAEHDRTIPMRHTQRLMAHFRPGIATFVLLPGEGHTFGLTPDFLAALRSGE
jgi:pimeloyl-ACP methyl ester carboxylesterase